MPDTVLTFFRVVALAMVALLPLINPPGAAPIFLALTPGMSDALRATVAGRIARHTFVLLAAAMLVGSYVLILFGLSLPVIKIAGGLLVVATAWRLVSAESGSDSGIIEPPANGDVAGGWTFYPLTFPITVGPGSLSVAVALGAGVREESVINIPAIVGTLVGMVVVATTVYMAYRSASRLVRVLGATGTVVLLRLSAFILLAIGVQILCDGLAERFALGT